MIEQLAHLIRRWRRPVDEAPTALPEVTGHPLTIHARDASFDEQAYLRGNPDVAEAIATGKCPSAEEHFVRYAVLEGRQLRFSVPDHLRAAKRDRILPLLGANVAFEERGGRIDCLSDALRATFDIVQTDNVSANAYDERVMDVIRRHARGLVLDCGAGQRDTYYDHVVNYEIVPYDSTDVLGVAEVLPFKDNSFDAVLSLAVLEHVKDPFQAARELVRVLKPGGELVCCVPFLQPLHGYPHHYYNMTYQGLQNLFPTLVNKRVEVYGATQPIWALTWMLSSYANGLPEDVRRLFLDLKVSDLVGSPTALSMTPIVTALSAEANYELAAANVLFGRKARQ